MPLTDVEICQKSLLMLGAKPIQSLNEENFRSQLCNSLYPELKRNLLSRHTWNFATVKTQLGQINSDPVGEWENHFQLPSNLINGPKSVFTDKNSKSPIQSWEIIEDRLLTDHNEIWIDYVKEVEEQNFPPYFVELIKHALAAQLAKPVTDQTTEAQRLDEKTYGPASDNEEGGLLGVAKRIDSKGQSTQAISDFPLTDVRHQGSSFEDGY